jgi:MFS transporter, PPP family, 3-phenylpropionic acid transporter
MRRLRTGALPAFILLYAAMYAAFGAASPFWPRFFASRGVTPEQLGLLFGFGTLIRLVAGPLAARAADLLGAVRTVFATCTGAAAALALALLTAGQFPLLTLIRLGQEAALAPITTLADALALSAANAPPAAERFEYGWVRGAGSAAFVVGTLIAGQLLGRFGFPFFVWMHAALLAAAVLGAPLVPPLRRALVPPHGRTQLAFGGVRDLLQIAVFRRLIIVAALVYGSHGMHDTFAVIRWNAAGIGPAAASVLWSESVVAEIAVFFLFGPALIDRLHPSGAAVVAAVAGIVRWTVMGESTALPALAAVQPLHGLTFALLHLACMRIIAFAVPVRVAATAQAFYALGAGVMTALVTLASGPLYALLDGQAFLAMALLCAAALPAALGLRSGNSLSPAHDV